MLKQPKSSEISLDNCEKSNFQHFLWPKRINANSIKFLNSIRCLTLVDEREKNSSNEVESIPFSPNFSRARWKLHLRNFRKIPSTNCSPCLFFETGLLMAYLYYPNQIDDGWNCGRNYFLQADDPTLDCDSTSCGQVALSKPFNSVKILNYHELLECGQR